MKRTIYLIIFILLMGCTTNMLNVRMTAPTSDSNTFYNENIKIDFSFIPTATLPGNPFTEYEVTSVGITIDNIASNPIKIMWDDISLIIDGYAHRIIHKGIRLAEKEKFQAPTTIPPGAKLFDQITPVDKIHTINDSWAYWALINKNQKGKHSIRVYIPYILNGETQTIDCEFEASVIN